MPARAALRHPAVTLSTGETSRQDILAFALIVGATATGVAALYVISRCLSANTGVEWPRPRGGD